MSKLRTVLAVAALAAVALLVPSTAAQAAPTKTSSASVTAYQYWWGG